MSDALEFTIIEAKRKRAYAKEQAKIESKNSEEVALFLFERYKALTTAKEKVSTRNFDISFKDAWADTLARCVIKCMPPGNGHDQYPPKMEIISSRKGNIGVYRVQVSGNDIGYYKHEGFFNLPELDELVVDFVLFGENPVRKIKESTRG